MRKLLFIFALSWSLLTSGEGLWQRAVINYSRHTYHSGNQNWQISQSKEGWMYFANNNGLLEFDGSTWNTFPLPGQAKVRSVKAVGDTVYVGALGQFGRFVRDTKGKMVYQMLSDNTPDTAKINIWNIHQIGDDIYFQGDYALYVNRGNAREDCYAGIGYSAVVYNRLYAVSKHGVFLLVGGEFQRLEGIDVSATSDIIGILPYQNQLLLITVKKGLFLYGNHELRPLKTAADAIIHEGQLSCAAIQDDMLAMGTLQDGVILLNLRQNIAEHLSIAHGLQNKTVISAAFDRDHNLWLGLDNGIDCIPLHSPLRFLNSRQTNIGSGYCSIYYHGKLYLGTNQGLYVAEEGQPIRFIEGTGNQVLCLDTIGDKLFCGGRQFFLMIDGDRIQRFDNRGVWGVRSIGQPDVLLTGSYWGLRLLRRGPQGWKMGEEVRGTDISAKTFFVEDDTHAIWVANKERGLFRLQLTDNLDSVKSKKCYNSAQLPKGDNVCIARVQGETVIASRQGLFHYDTTNDRLEPFDDLEKRLGGHAAYTYIHQDDRGNIWYATDGTMHLTDGKRTDSYLNDYLIDDFESVNLTNDRRHAIIGTEDGFVLMRTNVLGDTIKQIRPYIRKVYIGNNADTLYYGANSPRIAWGDNSLWIEYSANNYDPTQTVRYSYWLEGSDEGWSAYSRRHNKEYTNLPEGDYKFHVRVITSAGQQPEETSFAFTILPPWYRTWWAYALYLLAALALADYVYLRIRKSRQRLIQQKDEQIHEQEEKIETLEDEKLQIELRARQDELVRSRMNIVRKNEMLQEIKKTAVSINNGLSENNYTAIKRRVVRLIGQIDTNIEHDDDLEAFRNSFDSVHHNFLKTLEERFPQLSHKEKMLCAYIRMNLMSKEIAPLLNISTRGVEISRYRIRQKLNLDSKDSLTEFLQRL